MGKKLMPSSTGGEEEGQEKGVGGGKTYAG
jgi:hypothetical protein